MRRAAYVLLLALAVGAAGWHEKSLSERRALLDKSRADVEQKREELQAVTEMVATTGEHVRQLQSDMVEVEASIREKSRLVREKETVFEIKEVPQALPPTASIPSDPTAVSAQNVPAAGDPARAEATLPPGNEQAPGKAAPAPAQ